MNAAADSAIASVLPKVETHDYSGVKFEGLSDGETKAFVDVLSKHKLEPKAAEALFNDLRAENRKQYDALAEAHYKALDEKFAADPAFSGARRAESEKAINASLALFGIKNAADFAKAREQRPEFFRDPEVLHGFLAVGRVLLKATADDTAAVNESAVAPGPLTLAQKIELADAERKKQQGRG